MTETLNAFIHVGFWGEPDSKEHKDSERYTRDSAIGEIISTLWEYTQLGWVDRIQFIDLHRSQKSTAKRSELIMANVNKAIESDPRGGITRTLGDTIKSTFDGYYINRSFARTFAGNLIKLPQMLWRLAGDGIDATPRERDYLIPIVHCLTQLSTAYPQHVVDLDVFYGVPANRADEDLNEFYRPKPMRIRTVISPPAYDGPMKK